MSHGGVSLRRGFASAAHALAFLCLIACLSAEPMPARAQSAGDAAAAAGSLVVDNPFSLPAATQSDIELTTQNIGLLKKASALAVDGASAAIVLFQTSSTASVTFSATNGATLLAYDPKFLSKAPRAGAKSLTVTPVAVGSAFYAAALLQSPLGAAAFSFAANVAVAAETGSVRSTVALRLTPPPVILAHGLWGDETSLSFFQSALNTTPPWSKTAGLVYAISYPGAESFTAPAPLRVMKTDVGAVLAQMQRRGVVVGRVDVIAHSMGGLLARAYSATAAYKALESRGQGQFHAVVTLDTPETGSALATYLWNHKTLGIAAWAQMDPSLLLFWSVACGSTQVSLETCMNAQGYPVTGGAIQALIPGSAALKSLPAADIPDSVWDAVGSTNTSGVERTIVQELIDATHPTPTGIPTINQILGVPNDDIVALASQFAGVPAHEFTESGYAHSSFFGATSAVTTSPLALAQSTCWLAKVACAKAAEPAAYDALKDMRAPARLESCATVEPPAGPLTLGEPFTLSVQGQGLGEISVTQRQTSADFYRTADEFHPGDPSWSGSAVRVVPRVLGDVRLDVAVVCADGGLSLNHVDVVVGVDPAKVSALKADGLSRLELPASECLHYLSPEATVAGVAQPVKVRSFAHYRAVSASGDAPFSVDAQGAVRCAHAGAGAVEVSFAGRADRIEVVVK